MPRWPMARWRRCGRSGRGCSWASAGGGTRCWRCSTPCSRRGRPVAAPPEPGAGPPAGVGQRVRRPAPGPRPRRGAAGAAAAPADAGGAAALRRGRERLAPARGRHQPGAGLPVPLPPPPGRPRPRRARVGVPVADPAQLGPRQLDGARRRAPRAARRRSPPPSPSSSSRPSSPRGRRPQRGEVPLVLFDAGYDASGFTDALAGTPVALLIRLRSNRHFWFAPARPTPPTTGRPKRHGAKFVCNDPATWPAPTAELHVTDEAYGQVAVRAWAGLHTYVRRPVRPGVVGQYRGPAAPRPRDGGAPGGRPPARPAAHPGRRLAVVAARRRRRDGAPRPPSPEDLDRLWRGYCRRADLEQTFRFLKQALRLGHPAGAPARAGRPLDLAGARGLHPAAPRPRRRRRPPPAVGAPAPAGPAHARAGAPEFCNAGAVPAPRRRGAKTLRALPGPAQRAPLGAGGALPARQEGRLTPAAPPAPASPPRLRRPAVSPHGPVWLKGQDAFCCIRWLAMSVPGCASLPCVLAAVEADASCAGPAPAGRRRQGWGWHRPGGRGRAPAAGRGAPGPAPGAGTAACVPGGGRRGRGGASAGGRAGARPRPSGRWTCCGGRAVG